MHKQKLDNFLDFQKSDPIKASFIENSYASIIQNFALSYSSIPNSANSGIDFIHKLMQEIEVSFDIHPKELDRIPKKGPFICVSNYLFPGISELALLKVISEVRPDIKLIENQYLQNIKPLKDFVLSLNPYSKKTNSKKAFLTACRLLNEGKPLGVFPVGNISESVVDKTFDEDPRWDETIIKFIKEARVPVITMFFKSDNRNFTQSFNKIHPVFGSLNLGDDKATNKVVKVNIGSAISVTEQQEFDSIAHFGRFLRVKTHAYSTSQEVQKIFKIKFPRASKKEEIREAVPYQILIKEINKLDKTYLLMKHKKYHVFCAPSLKIPNLLNEIGRLREITFREVGEGTNRSIDLDEYDLYYHQLIIWDDEKHRIVGAYRIGKGKEIIERYGTKGFYIRSLFALKKPFTKVLEKSLELGRSFIVKEYQKDPMSLFLLWKGILYFILQNPEYRYLIGPVSISNEYSALSKGMIVEFIRANYFNHDLAKYIKPKKRFVASFNKNIDKDLILDYAKGNINKIDKFIKDFEPYYTIPVLMKKYLKQNAKIIGFNVDPKFNNCLDGLIILDLMDVPSDTIKLLTKELKDAAMINNLPAERSRDKVSNQELIPDNP